MAVCATSFRKLLDARGIGYTDMVLETPVGAPPGVTVVFSDRGEADRFHGLTSGIGARTPCLVQGRGWVVTI